MGRKCHREKDFASLDERIEKITIGLYGDDEKLWFLIDDVRAGTAWEDREDD